MNLNTNHIFTGAVYIVLKVRMCQSSIDWLNECFRYCFKPYIDQSSYIFNQGTVDLAAQVSRVQVCLITTTVKN